MFLHGIKSKAIVGLFLLCLFTPLQALYAQNNSMLTFNFLKQPQLAVVKYSENKGFGNDNFINSTENAFSIKLDEGDYQVSIEVGSTKNNNNFLVFSEDRRVMSFPITLNKDQSKHISFYVNVKSPQLLKAEQDDSNSPRVRLRGDEDISRNWDHKLTLSLSNKSAIFKTINIMPNKVGKILLAGDSTVADQAAYDYASWGQFLPALISNRLIINNARSGETLKSFISSLRWDKTLSQTQAGDIVLIQFAHNDEKKQWPRTYAAPEGAYPEYLRAYIADIRQRHAFPVLVTPVARRIYDDKGTLINTHKGYDKAVHEIARATNTPVIDLTTKTSLLYKTLGKNNAKKLFADQGKDKTHHNPLGALLIANILAEDLHVIYPELHLVADPNIRSAHTNINKQMFTKDLWPDMRHLKVSISGN